MLGNPCRRVAVLAVDAVVTGVDLVRIVDRLDRGIPLVDTDLHHPAIGEIGPGQQQEDNRYQNKELVLGKSLPEREALLGLFLLDNHAVGLGDAPKGLVDQEQHHHQQGKHQGKGPQDQFIGDALRFSRSPCSTRSCRGSCRSRGRSFGIRKYVVDILIAQGGERRHGRLVVLGVNAVGVGIA